MNSGWHKVFETESFLQENFLRAREKYYVSACARYRVLNYFSDHAWILYHKNKAGGRDTEAMLIQSGMTLFPVLAGQKDLNLPAYLLRSLKNANLHALHGLAAEVDIILDALVPLGLEASEVGDYDLMSLESENDLKIIKKPPAGLILRRSSQEDFKSLLPLEIEYEKEEVLPPGALVDKKICALNLSKIMADERILIAELGGRVVGKINTNAAGYETYQIGGVFVLPNLRHKGIGKAMISSFVRMLLAEGKGVTLFVRKANQRAISIYASSGFKNIGDYKIIYI